MTKAERNPNAEFRTSVTEARHHWIPKPFGSRSEHMTVAVGFNPRSSANRIHVAERRLKCRMTAAGVQSSLRDEFPLWSNPWAEAHGYYHGLAPRGTPCERQRRSGTQPRVATLPWVREPKCPANPEWVVAGFNRERTQPFQTPLQKPEIAERGASLRTNLRSNSRSNAPRSDRDDPFCRGLFQGWGNSETATQGSRCAPTLGRRTERRRRSPEPQHPKHSTT